MEAIPGTSFVQESIREDPDLRYILRAQPDVIEDGLFILSEEYSRWQESGRSIDLLGLDSQGRLVVIELKRTSTGEHAELQAIRYAAMVANITLERAVEGHKTYMEKWNIQGDAGERIQQHLANAESEEIDTERPRIVLVSAGFSTELTTSVLWLNDSYGLDIKCIRLQLYRSGSEELLVETTQVIPLPESADYQVRFRDRENEVRKQRSAASQRVQGGEVFEEHIQLARPEFQKELRRFYDWAIDLKEEGLVTLESNPGKTCTTLGVNVPGRRRIVTAWNYWIRAHEVTFDRNAVGKLSPQTAPAVMNLLNTSNSRQTEQGNVTLFSPITDDLLAALAAAYREANGLTVAGDGDEGA